MDNSRFRFRAWDGESMFTMDYNEGFWAHVENNDWPVMQYIGIEDRAGKEFCTGDIGRFPNGDTFQLCMEEWLEVFVEWIGEPKCADQTRDLYRISNAEIIGNIFENKSLLEEGK